MTVGIGNYVIDWELAQQLSTKLAIVAVIVVVTWALAKGAKWGFAKLVDQVPVLQRQGGNGESVGESLGKIVSLLIWLLGLIAVLQRLGLTNVIKPLNTLLDQVMGFIPHIIGAGIILFVGAAVARIVRQLVETTLSAANLDKWAARGGVDKVTGHNTLSKTIATICYVLIIIPVAIGALDALEISSISDPAKAMLGTVLAIIPALIGAAIILGLAYFVGGWVADMFEDLLSNLGFDRAIKGTGLIAESVQPSKVVGRVTMIAIMLAAAVQATQLIDFPALNAILATILDVGSRVIFGSVIIAVGILIANLIAGVVKNASDGGTFAPNIVRYATIGLFVAMGLSQMGIGGPIVETAFTAIVVAAAVAAAIAFGLGGRDAAARMLERLEVDASDAPAAKPARKK